MAGARSRSRRRQAALAGNRVEGALSRKDAPDFRAELTYQIAEGITGLRPSRRTPPGAVLLTTATTCLGCFAGKSEPAVGPTPSQLDCRWRRSPEKLAKGSRMPVQALPRA